MGYISKGDRVTQAEQDLLDEIANLGDPGDVLTVSADGLHVEWNPAGGGGATTALDNLASVAINTSLISDTDNTDALGSVSIGWSDLFLGSGAVINFNGGDVTITHSSNQLTIGGGSLALGTNSLALTGSISTTSARVTKIWTVDIESTNMPTVGGTSIASTFSPIAGSASIVTVGALDAGSITANFGSINIGSDALTAGSILASSNDVGALGASGTAWADLFLASGAVINFAASNVLLTHSSGILTLTTGTLALAANNLTMTGSIAATGARVTKGWFTDIESTNMPTVGGVAVLSSLTAPQFTTIELGHATQNTLSASGGILSIETIAIPTISSTHTLTNKTMQAVIIDYVIEPAVDDTYAGESSDDKLAGDTIAQFDVVYLDSSSGRWEFADADAVGTSGTVLLAMAAAAGTDGNAMNVIFRGVVRNDGWTWSAAGKPLYVSTTPGGLTETAPSGADDVIRIAAYTLSDDAIYFNPENDYVIHT